MQSGPARGGLLYTQKKQYYPPLPPRPDIPRQLMNESTSTPSGDAPERRAGPDRAPAETAPGRCLLYAVFSDITASPFDAEPAVAGEPLAVAELGLPYALTDPEPLLAEWRGADTDALKREYSGLFEVGSDGPPVPIREDLHRNQPAKVKESIVRFYDYFGYGLSEKFQWAPDHLSVELEFMHYLAYKESEAAAESDALAYQLAQHDFCERHLVHWVPELAERAAAQQPDALYSRLLAALSDFLQNDFAWQKSTINHGV